MGPELVLVLLGVKLKQKARSWSPPGRPLGQMEIADYFKSHPTPTHSPVFLSIAACACCTTPLSGKTPSSNCTCATGLKVASKPRSWPICGTGRLWGCEALGPDKRQLAVAFTSSRFTESSRTSPVCLVLFEFFRSMPFLPTLAGPILRCPSI
jgi:hypothetical protein